LHSRCVLVVGEEDLLSLLSSLEHLQYEHRKLKPDGLMFPDTGSSCLAPSGSSTDKSISSGPHDPISYHFEECPVRKTFIDFHVPHPAAMCASRSA